MHHEELLAEQIEELEKTVEGTVAKAFAKLSKQVGLANAAAKKKRGIRGGQPNHHRSDRESRPKELSTLQSGASPAQPDSATLLQHSSVRNEESVNESMTSSFADAEVSAVKSSKNHDKVPRNFQDVVCMSAEESRLFDQMLEDYKESRDSMTQGLASKLSSIAAEVSAEEDPGKRVHLVPESNKG